MGALSTNVVSYIAPSFLALHCPHPGPSHHCLALPDLTCFPSFILVSQKPFPQSRRWDLSKVQTQLAAVPLPPHNKSVYSSKPLQQPAPQCLGHVQTPFPGIARLDSPSLSGSSHMGHLSLVEWAMFHLRTVTSALPSWKCPTQVNKNAMSSTEVFPDPITWTFSLITLCTRHPSPLQFCNY